MIEEIYEAFKRSSGVCTDTRHVKQGSVFFALKGPSFNANGFALEAISLGCIAAVVDEVNPTFKSNPNIYVVDNVLHTLQRVAHHHRTRLRIPIIGLTGSNGKTTTKELIKSVLDLQYNCFATQGNLNNHIGVPLSILSVKDEHEIAIIEMGANHRNEISELCKIAEPEYGLITNIGLAHLEGFGGEEGVYLGKKELFDFIEANQGLLFVNASDAKVVMAAKNNKSITYGIEGNSDFNARLLPNNQMMSFEWWTHTEPQEIFTINTQLNGGFNLINALAAVAVGSHFGVTTSKIKKGLENYVPSNNRSQMARTANSNTLIIDCYNANPSSMKAAIESLNLQPGTNKICILGDMMELGASSQAEHTKLIDMLDNLSFQEIYLVGENFGQSEKIKNHQHFISTNQLAAHLEAQPISNATILLKGSRKMKLESLIEKL